MQKAELKQRLSVESIETSERLLDCLFRGFWCLFRRLACPSKMLFGCTTNSDQEMSAAVQFTRRNICVPVQSSRASVKLATKAVGGIAILHAHCATRVLAGAVCLKGYRFGVRNARFGRRLAIGTPNCLQTKKNVSQKTFHRPSQRLAEPHQNSLSRVCTELHLLASCRQEVCCQTKYEKAVCIGRVYSGRVSLD